MRTIFHVFLKNTPPYRTHHYFGSISAIYENEKIKNAIDVSIHTLYKYDFDSKFENDYCYIFKSVLQVKTKKSKIKLKK